MIGPVTVTPSSLVFVNGERCPADGTHVSARDRGFTLADGLFETMRARGGVIFRADQHLRRLCDGLRLIHIPEPPMLPSWLAQAAAAADPQEVSVRLTVTRGPGPGGLTPPEDLKPTVVIAVSSMPRFPESTYTAGLKATLARGRRNSRAMSAGLKTLAYTDAVLALIDAQRAGADEAIFLDEDGHCSEATASNLFICRDGVLRTPPTTCAALPGITRKTVLELAAAAGMRTDERAFGPAELTSADEVFLTSSLRGLAPVTNIDGRPIGSGVPGDVTRRLAAAYAELVERECAGR